MTPKTFIENFGHVVNAPLGVSRLREMVYALAISGSLCPQRAEDGTGQRLLEQIVEGKEIRIQNGVFKRSPKLEGSSAKYSDSLPRIPRWWAWSRLVDVGEINPRNDADDERLASFAPMNAISELHNGPIRSEDRKWASIKKGFTHFADGDVMVAKITPCFENGKGAVLRGLTNGIGAGTTELHVVRPLPGVLPEYIYLFLRSPYFKAVGESKMTGTAGQKRLSTEYFALREFPLPPLEEQKRIVAKVDELMRLCDRLEAQQQTREKLLPLLSRANHTRFIAEPTEANLGAVFREIGSVSIEDLREAVLDLAESRRLVPVTADARTVSMEELVGAANLKNGLSLQQSSTPQRFHCLPISSLRDGRVDLSTRKPIVVTEAKAAPYLIRRDDVFIVRGSGSKHLMGQAGIVEDDPADLLFPDLFIRVRLPVDQIEPKFFLLLWNGPSIRRELEHLAKTTSGIWKINQGHIRSIQLVLPQLSEQREIVAMAARLHNIIDDLHQKRRRSRSILEAFAKAAVSAITSTDFTENERMKPPKTEVVTALKVGRKPKKSDTAPLATLLLEQKAEASAKTLWQLSGLEIDTFYRQLKTEMANGWIDEDNEKRAVHEVEAR